MEKLNNIFDGQCRDFAKYLKDETLVKGASKGTVIFCFNTIGVEDCFPIVQCKINFETVKTESHLIEVTK